MVKAICMFRLKKGVDENEFEKFFKKHVEEAKKLERLQKYTVSKNVDHSDTTGYFRINELYYNSKTDADHSFSTKLAEEATNELLEWVTDFTCVIAEEVTVK